MNLDTCAASPFLPPILESIPQELQAHPQWVCWMATPSTKKENPKPDKVPVNARTGQPASTTTPNSWSSYHEAVNFYQSKLGVQHTVSTKNGPRTGPIAGIGFVMTESDPYVGIDIDGCINTEGKITPFAEEIINRVGCYTETSPSGTGIRIFVKGTFPKKGHRDSKLEVYQSKHYLTVTGHELCNLPIQENQAALDWLYYEYCHKDKVKTPTSDITYVSQQGTPLTSEDEALIEKIKTSRTGSKFTDLYSGGDLSKHNNDHSSADMALCCILAFWCAKDPAQMDRIFRASTLIRDKWDEMRGKETYGAITIRKAIEATTDTYREHGQETPQYQSSVDEDSVHEKLFLPPAPLEAFPSAVQSVLREAAQAYGVPIEIPVACFLAFVSCLVGQSLTISIKYGWEEATNLWIALVAPSGTGKSPVMKAFMTPVMKLEYQEKLRFDKELEEYRKSSAVFTALEKESIKAALSKSKPAPQLSINKPVEPKKKCATADDATTEALGNMLEANPKGIMLFRDELSGWLADRGQYNGSKTGETARYLSGHSRGPWVTSRAAKDGRNNFIPEACLGILGSIQPGVMPKVFEGGVGGVDEESGFLPRFCFIQAIPDSASTWCDAIFSQHSVMFLEKMAQHFWGWNVERDATGHALSRSVPVSSAAKALYIEWYDMIAQEAYLIGNAAPLRKLQAHALRLCLILHSVDAALAGTDGTGLVSEDTMRRALKLANWIKTHQEQCWRFFKPGQKVRQVTPLERTVMLAVIERATEIEANGWKIGNQELLTQVRKHIKIPELTPEKLAKSAKSLGLKPCTVGNGRGREVSANLLNEFRVTVGSVDTVNSPTGSKENSMMITAPVPSGTVGAGVAANPLPTVADSGHTVFVPQEMLTALGCSTEQPVTTVPPAVLENFEAAMRSFNTRYNVPTHTM